VANGNGVAGPMVNVTDGGQGKSSDITFENNSYGLHGEPSQYRGQ
jgi:hypothetical protein